MKAAAMMTMAAVLGSAAWAAGKSGEQKVVVCFEESGGQLPETPQARMIASKLFQTAGVKLEVLSGQRSCEGQRDQVIVVGLLTNTPKHLLPGALAYAREFEGVHIQVFYDRIANLAESRELRLYMLAYVIVHEITHILEGYDMHSASGIMKAYWGSPEYGLMRIGQLRFTDEDIKLIHAALAAREPHRASGTLVATAGLAATQPPAER
jgi:hypothetical protein